MDNGRQTKDHRPQTTGNPAPYSSRLSSVVHQLLFPVKFYCYHPYVFSRFPHLIGKPNSYDPF